MSRCRCDDKIECQNKINTLENARSGLSEANGSIHTVSETLSAAAGEYVQHSIVRDIQSTASYLSGLSGDLGSVRGRIDGEISKQISLFKSQYEEMTREDDDYHEEQERLEEERAEQERLQSLGLIS